MDLLLRTARRPARELGWALLDLLLPPACPACGEPAAGLCRRCAAALHRRARPGCVRCGEPVLGEGLACGSDHPELRNLTRLVAPFWYAGTAGALVRRFKLDADAAAGRCLLRAMVGAWHASSAGGRWHRAGLVPVPLHHRRRRARGFDQARWLARGLAARLQMPVLEGVLARARDTLPQGDPRVTSRSGNVEGAFVLAHPDRVVGRRIVLVDDVFTSGATGRACAALLVQAGAAGVAMITACRS